MAFFKPFLTHFADQPFAFDIWGKEQPENDRREHLQVFLLSFREQSRGKVMSQMSGGFAEWLVWKKAIDEHSYNLSIRGHASVPDLCVNAPVETLCFDLAVANQLVRQDTFVAGHTIPKDALMVSTTLAGWDWVGTDGNAVFWTYKLDIAEKLSNTKIVAFDIVDGEQNIQTKVFQPEALRAAVHTTKLSVEFGVFAPAGTTVSLDPETNTIVIEFPFDVFQQTMQLVTFFRPFSSAEMAAVPVTLKDREASTPTVVYIGILAMGALLCFLCCIVLVKLK